MHFRRAFTLVELLVVIAIVGVLVALLLPAVQAAREAARKVECANNFKQVALATLNYTSSNDHLPALIDTRYARRSPQGKPGWVGWRFSILPFAEERALHEKLADPRDWKYQFIPFKDQEPIVDPSKPAIVPTYLCPSTPGTPRMHPRTKIVSASDESVLFDAFAARQNSAVGWVFDQHATTTRREPGAWMGTTRPEALHSNSKTVFAGKAAKLRWITGGLSKTLLVVENAGSPDQILGNKRTENLNSLSWISGTLGFHENLFIRFDPFPWEGASALEGPVNLSLIHI